LGIGTSNKIKFPEEKKRDGNNRVALVGEERRNNFKRW